jgi:hypothetical protein
MTGVFHTAPPYAVARFDGALVFEGVQAGLLTTGVAKSPIVHFEVLTGLQTHPIWALDALAVKVYSYSLAAKSLKLSRTQLQISVTASWVSTNEFSILIATHIEWHVSPSIRNFMEHLMLESKKNKAIEWPSTELHLPVQPDQA